MRRSLSELCGAAALVLAASSCAAVFGQSDDFAPTIPGACKTEDGCRQALAEAKMRQATCEPNTIGALKCSDAQRDIVDVTNRLSAFQQQDARDQAAQDARVEAAAEENQKAETRRQEARRAWTETSHRECVQQWSVAPCDAPSDDLDPNDRAACRSACESSAAFNVDQAFQAAVRDCSLRLANQGGTGDIACAFEAPPAGMERLSGRSGECADACRTRYAHAAEQVAAQRSVAATATAPAPASASRHKATSGTGMLRCNDGQLSPTCQCGRASNQGCCSHHGGVAGCSSDE